MCSTTKQCKEYEVDRTGWNLMIRVKNIVHFSFYSNPQCKCSRCELKLNLVIILSDNALIRGYGRNGGWVWSVWSLCPHPGIILPRVDLLLILPISINGGWVWSGWRLCPHQSLLIYLVAYMQDKGL